MSESRRRNLNAEILAVLRRGPITTDELARRLHLRTHGAGNVAFRIRQLRETYPIVTVENGTRWPTFYLPKGDA